MKKRDYIMLARRSLKERKKSTRSTVVGLAFGLIILIPMFVAIFGVNISMNNQINSKPYALNYKVGLADYRIETADEYKGDGYGGNWSGSKNLDNLLADPNVTNKVVYELYDVGSHNWGGWYSVDGADKVNTHKIEMGDFGIIDIDKSDSIFPTNLTDNYSGGIFMPGYDQGFTSNGKRQVVLSQKMLGTLGLLPQDVYLKSWSYSKSWNFSDSEEQEWVEAFLCQNYTVVGVIKSEVSDLYSRWDLMASGMFFTSVNVYNDAGEGMLKPRRDTSVTPSKLIFDNKDNVEELNKEYMMLAWNQAFGGLNKTTYATTSVLYGAASYKTLIASIKRSESIGKATIPLNLGVTNCSSEVISYNRVYQIVNIVSIICIMVGIVMLLCSLISLYSTIYHSVSQRKHYLTMLRAIGARDDVVPKLYLAESVIVATRANIFVLIFGFALSTLLKFVLEWALKSNGVVLAIAISWGAIVVGVLVAIALLYAVTTLFAYVCTRKIVRRKITDVLQSQ